MAGIESMPKGQMLGPLRGHGASGGSAFTPVIHLNAAGAALRSTATTAKMLEFLDMETKLGAYEMASTYGKEDMERPYRELATLLGCEPEEVSIVCSATEAWNELINGLAWKLFSEGAGIVTSITEYGSNYLTYLQLKERFKVSIHVVGERDGDVDVDELERLIQEKDNVVLISLPHVPTNSGRVYDVARVGEVARRHGVLFLLDGCQSVGQIEVDVGEIGCDMLTGTSRKWLRGPRGCGFLYCSARCRQMFEPATIDVHSAVLSDDQDSYAIDRRSRMFEKYEMSFAAKAGLGVAVAELNKLGIRNVEARVTMLASNLRTLLGTVVGVKVEDRGSRLCGIVSFSVEGGDGETAQARTERLFAALGAAGTYRRWFARFVSFRYIAGRRFVGGHSCLLSPTPRSDSRSLVSPGFSVSISRRTSTLIDMSQRGIECVIRVSPHVYNSEHELRRLVDEVRADMGRLVLPLD